MRVVMKRLISMGLALALAGATACGGKAIVDGVNGGGGSTSSTTSSNVGTTATGVTSSGTGSTCPNFAAAYQAAVDAARACDPTINADPCPNRVTKDPTQCCSGLVAVGRDMNALAKVKDAINAFDAAGCAPKCVVDCVMMPPVSGICNPTTKKCDTVQSAGTGGA